MIIMSIMIDNYCYDGSPQRALEYYGQKCCFRGNLYTAKRRLNGWILFLSKNIYIKKIFKKINKSAFHSVWRYKFCSFNLTATRRLFPVFPGLNLCTFMHFESSCFSLMWAVQFACLLSLSAGWPAGGQSSRVNPDQQLGSPTQRTRRGASPGRYAVKRRAALELPRSM